MPTPTDRFADRKVPAAAAKAPAFELLEDRRLMSALPFTLEFDAPVAGTINDKDDQGTGFTSVQQNKNGDQYQASLIDLDGGVLKLTTRGTAAAGGNSGADNTLVNLLQTDFDGRGDFEVTTTLVGGLGVFAQGYEQGGLSFGPDQDNYIKLVAIYNNSGGPRLQFVDEYSDGNGGTTTSYPTGSSINAGNWADIDSAELKIVGNPATGRLTAYYRLDGAAAFTQVPHTITVPSDKRAAFFSATSKAGLIAFDRADAENITVTYDRFAIRQIAATTGPSVTAMRPANGTTNVLRDSFVAVDVSLPNGSIDPATVNGGTVFLRNNSTGALVPAGVNTTGGGDAITLTPAGVLDANTSYTFTVTSGRQGRRRHRLPALQRQLHHRHPRRRKRPAHRLRQDDFAEHRRHRLDRRDGRPRRQVLRRHRRRRHLPQHHQRRRHARHAAKAVRLRERHRHEAPHHRHHLRQGRDDPDGLRQPRAIHLPRQRERPHARPTTGPARSRASAGRTWRLAPTSWSACRAASTTT